MSLDLIVLGVAGGLIALSLSQFLIAGVSQRRVRVRHQAIHRTQLKRLRNATRIARLNSQLSTTSDGASSMWRVMEVVKVAEESLDSKSFYLGDPNQQDLPAFHPGQYVMVRPALAGKYQATRCYSLSVAPNSKLWRITVKRQETDKPLRPDRKTGGLSHWLHDHIGEGDCLLVGGPCGQFYLPPTDRSPLVLIAAGVGITPMASMLQFSTFFTPRRPVSLYFQAKDPQHWPLGEEVHDYCKLVDSCRVVSYFSRCDAKELQTFAKGLPGQVRAGRLNVAEIMKETSSHESHYYLCGPDDWMSNIRDQLLSQGVLAEQIHWESFGGENRSGSNAAIAGAANAGEIDDGALENIYQVQFARSGIDTVARGDEQSLWELAQANDVVIPSGCLSGVCGSCRVRLLEGSVSYDRYVSVSLKDDECLTCVARPVSNVVLDV